MNLFEMDEVNCCNPEKEMALCGEKPISNGSPKLIN